jgi:Spy/CpxP family protein refolding chaperone
MSWKIRSLTALFTGGLLVLAVSGCTGNMDPNQSVAQALTQLAQTAAQVPALNQLTVSDLVAGFQQYANQLGSVSTAAATQLTSDQQQQIEGLQAKLDSGQITQQEFATQVDNIIGNTAPTAAFGGFGFGGGPFAQTPGFAAADPLNLTDAQVQQAQDISQRLHDDLQKLRQDAHDKILAVLTPEQQAQLNQLFPQPAGASGASGPSGPLMPPPHGFGMHGREMGMHGGGPESFSQYLTGQLQLTAAQQTQIEQIRTDLRTAVQARHQQARDEFRAILTPEQLAILDQMQQPETETETATGTASSTGQ